MSQKSNIHNTICLSALVMFRICSTCDSLENSTPFTASWNSAAFSKNSAEHGTEFWGTWKTDVATHYKSHFMINRTLLLKCSAAANNQEYLCNNCRARNDRPAAITRLQLNTQWKITNVHKNSTKTRQDKTKYRTSLCKLLLWTNWCRPTWLRHF